MNLWIKELRAPFFTASIIPVILGAAVAFAEGLKIEILRFMVTLFGVVFLHAGGNMLNDYFDFRSGADIMQKKRTPFSGGSKVLVEGHLTPESVLIVSIISIIAGLVACAYLALQVGYGILLLGLSGATLAVLYTAPPFKLVYRGLGEFTVGLTFGPLLVLGSYYVQAGSYSMAPLFAGIPLGFFIADVLYINEFPDYEADKSAGKDQLVVLLGPKRAVPGYLLILLAAYTSIILGVLGGIMPLAALIGLLTIPIALKAYQILKAHYADVQSMLPANALTIKIHLQTGLLLIIGYLLARL